MDIGFKKLQDEQRVQSEMLNQGLATGTVNQHLSPNDFAEGVLRMLKKEIPKIEPPPRQPPDSPLIPDSNPSSGSSAPHQKAPSTPPSSPHRTSQRQNPHPVSSTVSLPFHPEPIAYRHLVISHFQHHHHCHQHYHNSQA